MTRRLLVVFLLLMFFLNVQQLPNLTMVASSDQPWEYMIGHEISSVAISHNGETIVVGTYYPYGALYYLANGELLWKYEISGSVYGLDISADGKYIVAVGRDVKFMTRDKRLLWKYHIPTSVNSAEMTPTAEYIAVGALNGIHLFSKNGEELWHYPFDPFKTRCVQVAITPDGKYIAATSLIEHDGGYVYLFSRDGDLIWKKKVSSSFVLSVDISDNGKYLTVGLDRKWLLLNKWGDVLYTNNELGGRAIAISKDSKYIAVRDTRKVYIFDMEGSKVGGIDIPFSEETGIGSPSKLMDITPDFSSLVIGIMHGENKIKVYSRFWGYVHVTSIPKNATLYLNDRYQGKVPQTLKLFPGEYRLELRKAGYFPYTESLTVSPGSNLSITAQLTSIARLSIYSTPSEAYVYLNDTLIGKTPVENYRLPPGFYEVRVSKKGYQDYREILTLEGRKSKTVNVNLVLLNGTLKMSSEPSGAEVYVNTSYRGITPLTLELPPGEYTVEIKKEGYAPYTEKARILPGEATEVITTLSLLNSALTIFSEPSEAKVYLNDTLIGNTPIQNYKVTPGTYTLEIVKDGYESHTVEVTVGPGESKNLSVTLSPIKGTLTITSEPSEAEAYLNNTLIGKTPLDGYQVIPGSYDLKIVKEGYQEYRVTVTLKPGETKSIMVALLKLEDTQTTTKVAKSTCGSGFILLLLLPLAIKRRQQK